MKRDLSVGSKINNWTVVSEPQFDNGKLRIKLVCNCGKESIIDVRTVNRPVFSRSCRRCSQIDRHDASGRSFNVGDKFMNLEVLKIYHGKVITYEVKCLKCDNIFHTGHATLHKKKVNRGLYCCYRCFDPLAKSRKKNTMCTEHISLTQYRTLQRQAEFRGIEFNITPDYLEKIFSGTCYLSGLPIVIGTYTKMFNVTDYGTASLDRINSSAGYVEGNVGWCYKKINVMKHIMSKTEFIEMCNIISNHNKD